MNIHFLNSLNNNSVNNNVSEKIKIQNTRYIQITKGANITFIIIY